MRLGGEAADYGPSLAGTAYGEVYFESSHWTTARLEDGAVRDLGAGSERGLGLRLLRKTGGRVETFFGSAQDFEPAAAARLRARVLPGEPGRGPEFAPARRAVPACRLDPACVSACFRARPGAGRSSPRPGSPRPAAASIRRRSRSSAS